MSRITTHCVCQNHDEHLDTFSKAYSILPNYLGKTDTKSQSPECCANNQSISKSHKFSYPKECNMCKNYENIEHFISGSLRPHSCPTEDNNEFDQTKCVGSFKESSRINPTRTQDCQQFDRKGSRSSIKNDKLKFHDQLYMSKNMGNVRTTHRLDTIHQGLNLYINKEGLPLIANNVPEALKHNYKSVHHDANVLFNDSLKKPSCGLKYIIFQKLSIMTHFLTKSKDKSSSLTMDEKHLSDENLFKENKCHTKRSKSFHTMDAKENHLCDINYPRSSTSRQAKQRLHRTKGSDTSNSSTGSIDAHAGSPITIMSTACGNFLGGLPNPLMANAFIHGNNPELRNECRPSYTSPEMMEFTERKNPQPLRYLAKDIHNDAQQTCCSHPNHSCPSCYYSFQKSCHPMLYDAPCQGHYHAQSPFQAQCSAYHCHPCTHSHVVMHTACTQLTPSCCQPSNHYCHCSNTPRQCIHHLHQTNPCQIESRIRSTLCQSCQYKNSKRCQSETLDDTRHCSDQLHQQARSYQQHSSNNIRYKFKSENRGRISKMSPSTHSKSVASSIPPPPPPPPPSSLYSANETAVHKGKHRKHCHNKSGKCCANCRLAMPGAGHSGDCTNTVQNIIYSHLNSNTDIGGTCATDSKVERDFFDQNPDLLYNYDNPVIRADTNTRLGTPHGQIDEKSDNGSDQDAAPTSFVNRQESDYGVQKAGLERRSAEIFKETEISYKPKFLSKTPETYKTKNERRHKRHQYDVQRMSKHKSISTTREYKCIDSDLMYRDDALDSPDAGSFMYHPISPLVQKNTQTVVPKKVSSFNSRQLCSYKDVNYSKPEMVRKAFQENMLSLREVGWYWGPLSFTEAESLMENKANGTFLVRDSGHDTYFLSLTFRVRETTYHTRIEYSQGTFSFWSQPESHSATTIVEFIDKAVAHSQSGKFHYFLLTNVPGQPPMEVSLLYPLSRHQIVHSLKHLSRFVILSHIRKDHIADLSVPPALRLYLLEKQYYISNLDEFVSVTMDSHPLSYKPSTIN